MTDETVRDTRLHPIRVAQLLKENAAIKRNPAQHGMSQYDIDHLCWTALRAWQQASDSARRVSFVWHGVRYHARLTSFYCRITTVRGEAVAACHTPDNWYAVLPEPQAPASIRKPLSAPKQRLRLSQAQIDAYLATDGVIPKAFRVAPPSRKLRLAILKRDHFCCQLCGAIPDYILRISVHVDHKVARAKGGTNDPSNLWTLCNHCNSGKGIDDL